MTTGIIESAHEISHAYDRLRQVLGSSLCSSAWTRGQVDQLFVCRAAAGGVEDLGGGDRVVGVDGYGSVSADGGGEGRVVGVPAAAFGRLGHDSGVAVQPAPPVLRFGSPRVA